MCRSLTLDLAARRAITLSPAGPEIRRRQRSPTSSTFPPTGPARLWVPSVAVCDAASVLTPRMPTWAHVANGRATPGGDPRALCPQNPTTIAAHNGNSVHRHLDWSAPGSLSRRSKHVLSSKPAFAQDGPPRRAPTMDQSPNVQMGTRRPDRRGVHANFRHERGQMPTPNLSAGARRKE